MAIVQVGAPTTVGSWHGAGGQTDPEEIRQLVMRAEGIDHAASVADVQPQQLDASSVDHVAVASTDHPNEPSGMTVLLDRSFTTEDETDAAGETWVDSSASSGTPQLFSIASDATAPKSPSGVGRILYPTGHPGSGSSSQTARSTGGFTRLDTAGQQLYLEWWWKISDNYYGHTGGQNKIFYIGHPIVVEFGYESGRGGTGDDPYFNWTFATQGGATLNYRCTTSGNEVSPSLGEAQILRDTWYHNELLLTMNTPGVANGSFRFWQNEVEIMRWTNANILRGDSSQYSYIQSLDWHPIYGGQDGESVPEAQSQYIDHIYASGDF